MELLNNFNGISLAIIIVLSYCAVLKSTKRYEQTKQQVFSRKYR
ncbi:hypothetical protein [Polynucleobacter brandtiae]|uniref:Uncharacterized protein n=1 Tax=Polynucleobacter brandtiae TaxID=1938816 RepID=A0A2M8VYL5_9BURK|nr:hypothetical protein [Polynucleobacter brandtiae]PJI82929.1 hypothetical protein B0G85_0319 [Polynucleobacter brandtiae]